MFPASCILLCLTVVATHQHVFTYIKQWGPFRRSATQCEMCYEGTCVVTRGPRCEYYAESSKLLSDDDDADDRIDEGIHRDGDKIDNMLFELVDSASSTALFTDCIPLVSQYTDCTEENVCIGCKLCYCSEEGQWVCSDKQKCRLEPKLTIDQRVIGIVIEILNRKEKHQERRVKRSANTINTQKDIKDKLTYTDISKWMYGVEPVNYQQKNRDTEEIREYRQGNETTFHEYTDIGQATSTTTVTNGSVFTTNRSINKNDNYLDLLEFNDILQSWRTDELITKKSYNTSQTKRRSEEIHINDIDNYEYDPIRLIKRDASKTETNGNSTILQINTTSSNFTYELILTDALQGLNKLISEKQKELEELLNIENNLLNIAKVHNITVNTNSTITLNYNKHHIAIYNFEKCVSKMKHNICTVIEDAIKTDTVQNSSDFQPNLKLIFNTIKKYILHETNDKDHTKENILSSHECSQTPRRHIELDNRYQNLNPIIHMGNILAEVSKAPTHPLRTLSQHARKILKRVIKQLYLDDFAIIDFIVQETYYDFDSYLESIGTKWNKMMQDIIDSQVFDTLYRVKLLHMRLKADITKMEDMITLLDFARNRRMTVANGVTIDKSVLRIQNNLQLINNNVQKIMKLNQNKRMRQSSAVEKNKPAKKKSFLQKLKQMFRSSKNDIKDMLRKRFSKSEIMKEIAKKKIDQLEKRRMLEYQETMKQWQENLNVFPGREKRSAWGFQAFVDRIKSIIPGYLKGKIKPVINKKKSGNRTQTTRTYGRKKQRHTQPKTITSTTVSRR